MYTAPCSAGWPPSLRSKFTQLHSPVPCLHANTHELYTCTCARAAHVQNSGRLWNTKFRAKRRGGERQIKGKGHKGRVGTEYTRVHVHVHVCARVCMLVCVHSCVHACACVCMRVHDCVHVCVLCARARWGVVLHYDVQPPRHTIP